MENAALEHKPGLPGETPYFPLQKAPLQRWTKPNMSAVHPPSLVIVTGASGHVASCIILHLLEKGYSVRGTVRCLSSGEHVRQAFSKYGAMFELVAVGDDISQDGVFDDAVKGASAVIHTASPVTMDAKKPEEFFVPSVGGTLSVLRSASKVGTVQRFLYLGTTGAAVMGSQDPTKQVVTRDNWNTMSSEAVKNLDDPNIGPHIYFASKVEAERAARKFVEEHKPSFTMTSILASPVFGPIPSSLTAPPRQDQFLGKLYNCFAKPPRVSGLNPIVSTVWVHNDDVADLFVVSLTSDKTPGQRLLATADKFSWTQVADILRTEFPERPYPPSSESAERMMYPGDTVIEFDTALEEELLGGKWRTLEDAILTSGRDLVEKEERGWDKF